MKQEEVLEMTDKVNGTFIGKATEPAIRKSKKMWIMWGVAIICLCLLGLGIIDVWQKSMGIIRLPHSTNNMKAKYVTADYLVQKGVLGNGDAEDACYVLYSEEELFTTLSSQIDTHLIVKGTVTDIKYVEAANTSLSDELPEKHTKYFYGAIVELKVDKVYRGDCKENETLKLWQYYGNHYIGQEFAVGDTGIFMPGIYNEQAVYSGWSFWAEDDRFVLTDLADYEICDLHTFLESEEGMDFERWQFVGAKDATTFEEVEEYIYRMIELYPTGLKIGSR